MILVTGGLGYIGSHTCVELQRAGHDLTIVDNLSNSKIAVLERIRALGGGRIEFYHADLRDRKALGAAFEQHPIDAVIHFAGHKAVGESVEKPLGYYDNNIGAILVLLETMARYGVNRIVFSSSATVYGNPQRLPLTEDHPLEAANPYGRTKQFIESILADIAATEPGFRHAALLQSDRRAPVGADRRGSTRRSEQPVPVCHASCCRPQETAARVRRRLRDH